MSFCSKKAKRQNSGEKLLSAFESYSRWNGISPFCFHLNGIWKTQLQSPMHTRYGAKWGTLPARPSQPSAADLNLAVCPVFTAHRAQVKSLTQMLPSLNRHLILIRIWVLEITHKSAVKDELLPQADTGGYVSPNTTRTASEPPSAKLRIIP